MRERNGRGATRGVAGETIAEQSRCVNGVEGRGDDPACEYGDEEGHRGEAAWKNTRVRGPR